MKLRRLLFSLPLSLLVFSTATRAFPARATSGGEARGPVAEVPPQVENAERVGRADPLEPMERIVFVLPSRDPEGKRRFLDAQQTPGSPDYHRWLSPAEYHARFGARQEDVAALESWLAEQGFSVEPGDPGRSSILFSGDVARVEAAFRTRIGLWSSNGEPTLANETPATLPESLAARTTRGGGIVSLHGFSRRRPLSYVEPLSSPLYNGSGRHYLAPADFRTIYNLDGLSGIDGTGAKIGVIGRTQIDLDDVRYFRNYFGLPANDPQVVLNGPDPGTLDQNEVAEACLDVEWSGAVAPKAKVIFVISKTTAVSDGIDLSIQYAVEQNLADALTVSFGACERDIGVLGMLFYDDIWAQAAAQGISAFIASGDSGAAGCDAANASKGTGYGVNGLSTTPWNTCVGGTQYLDTTNPSDYWASTNDGTTKKSALSYIPEGVWNESAAIAGGKWLLATGGGASISFTKPGWQNGPGVPADGRRDVPDISLAGAGHTSYLVVLNQGIYGIYGTSASSPAFAGITGALVQKFGGRLGNMNPTLYALGTAQYAGSGTKAFHDVTSGHNGVPSVTGFAAGTAYDLATGLGSVDVAALASAWPSAATPSNADFLLEIAPGALAMTPGTSATARLALLRPTGDVVASVSLGGLPTGVTAKFQPGKLSAPSVGIVSVGVPAKLTLTAASTTALGTYPVTVTATAGSIQRLATLYLTVSSLSGVSPAPGTETQVPVVLDIFGNASSHYTSDLVAVNRSDSDVTAQFRFSGSGASGPIIAVSLPARRQVYVPDVIAALSASGYSFPGDKLGTLYVTFTGVSDPGLVFAGSRISTPNLDTSVGGAFGTFASAVPSGTASTSEAWVYGLKKDASFRSNLAVVHAPGGPASLSGGTPIVVEVQLFDGATGAAAGNPVTRTLQPGEFWQIDAFANGGSAQQGYVRVRRTSGSDRFITYGVVNDGSGIPGDPVGTSDGSLIVSGGTEGVVPIVLDIPGTPHYQTEISLTNTSPAAGSATLVYTGTTAFGDAAFSETATVALAAGQQIQQTNAISWLRSLGISVPTSGPQGGTLKVTGAVAVARTWNPAPTGGTYGVAYPALGAAARAATSAWVYGLRQDADVRTNLAIADARAGDPSTRNYSVEIYDADSGSASPAATLTQTLAGGQWWQFNALLAGTGVTHGYARVRTTSGSSDFVAYGVVNDGPDPGSKTSDGSYVPMVTGD